MSAKYVHVITKMHYLDIGGLQQTSNVHESLNCT